MDAVVGVLDAVVGVFTNNSLSAPNDIPPELQKVLDNYSKEIFNLKQDGKLSRDLLTHYAKIFTNAIGLGFNGREGYAAFGGIDYDTPDFMQLSKLMSNAWQFSAAKNYAQTRELTHLLLDENGKPRSWSDFKNAAAQTNDKYALKYLKPEYDMAHSGATMAAKWVEIERNKSLLQFDAVIDNQTTDICRPLDKIILPYDHSFWNTYYPPNHWNCRSTVRQLSGGEETPEKDIKDADIKPMFRTNMGKKGLVFPEEHPYFIGMPEYANQQGMGAQRAFFKEIAIHQNEGVKHFIDGIGEVVVTNNSIRKILSQTISDHHLYMLKNHLSLVVGKILKEGKVIAMAVEYQPKNDSIEEQMKKRNITFSYLTIPGFSNLSLVIKTDKKIGSTVYSIAERKNRNK